MNRLQGKYALITGASQGLGRQIAVAPPSQRQRLHSSRSRRHRDRELVHGGVNNPPAVKPKLLVGVERSA